MGGAGVYLLYTAYSLFQERFSTESPMPLWVNYLFSILFALIAVALFIYSVVLWRRVVRSEKEYEESQKREEEAREQQDVPEQNNIPDEHIQN